MCKNCGSAGQATDDNIRRRVRFACWITKATDTYWECVILIALHGKNIYANAIQCYVTRKLPILFCAYDSEIRKKNLISWCYDTVLPSVLFDTLNQEFVRFTSIYALYLKYIWLKFWQFIRACRSSKQIPGKNPKLRLWSLPRSPFSSFYQSTIYN
jgi:hypothetical protein